MTEQRRYGGPNGKTAEELRALHEAYQEASTAEAIYVALAARNRASGEALVSLLSHIAELEAEAKRKDDTIKLLEKAAFEPGFVGAVVKQMAEAARILLTAIDEGLCGGRAPALKYVVPWAEAAALSESLSAYHAIKPAEEATHDD